MMRQSVKVMRVTVAPCYTLSMNISREIQQQGLDAVNAEITRQEQAAAEAWAYENDAAAERADYEAENAAERLLEVIDEAAHPDEADLGKIQDAITELRRRGDTLVKHEDLMLVVELAKPQAFTEDEYDAGDPMMGSVQREAERQQAAFDRLEIALGGKLR